MTMLLPYINEQLSDIIWRMEIDGLTDTIFLEIRHSDDKKVSFTGININTGKTNFTDVILPERWLAGIECGYDGILLLHNYQSEKAPVHKGVIAVDNTGEICWSNYTYAFDHLTVSGPVLYNAQIQPKKLFLADIKTGATIRAYEPLIDYEPVNDIIVPQILPVTALDQQFPVEPYGNIVHYLEHNNFRIVSLHSFNAGQLKQHLYITNGMDLVYEDLLNDSIQKMQPESFIMHKNALIYIKNKTELKVTNL
jgi:hypothetical protein